jgi:hypothetical protein
MPRNFLLPQIALSATKQVIHSTITNTNLTNQIITL